MKRGSGLLVPIFSLPNPYGIGSFGIDCRRFINFLAASSQKYWQMLPLNPTSYGDSPYQSFSAFALNPYFIDLDSLKKQCYLSKQDLKASKNKNKIIDYGQLYSVRYQVLEVAFKNSYEEMLPSIKKFIMHNRFWLTDYAEYMVIKEHFDNKSFQEWPVKLRKHVTKEVKLIVDAHEDRYKFWIWAQYVAYSQYNKIHKFAASKGISIIGDMPIYVALDSADVWAHHNLFQLSSSRRPLKVAGVPPDYFSTTGQLWGNPLYDYDKLQQTKFKWWKERVKAATKLYDVIRIDHFRGFEAYYSIDAKAKTAIDGSWVKAPGYEIIEAIKEAAKGKDVIAEDLGFLTQEVKDLKAASGFPGLKILQFAFDDGDLNNGFLPHHYETNSVAYIGTHDNDVLSSFLATHESIHPFMRSYLHLNNDASLHDELIKTLLNCNSDVAILTFQDLVKEGAETRFNLPGTIGGNWTYRINKELLTPTLATYLSGLTKASNR